MTVERVTGEKGKLQNVNGERERWAVASRRDGQGCNPAFHAVGVSGRYMGLFTRILRKSSERLDLSVQTLGVAEKAHW